MNKSFYGSKLYPTDKWYSIYLKFYSFSSLPGKITNILLIN